MTSFQTCRSQRSEGARKHLLNGWISTRAPYGRANQEAFARSQLAGGRRSGSGSDARPVQTVDSKEQRILHLSKMKFRQQLGIVLFVFAGVLACLELPVASKPSKSSRGSRLSQDKVPAHRGEDQSILEECCAQVSTRILRRPFRTELDGAIELKCIVLAPSGCGGEGRTDCFSVEFAVRAASLVSVVGGKRNCELKNMRAKICPTNAAEWCLP